MLAVLSILLAVVNGWVWVRLAWRAEGWRPRWARHLVEGALGAGGGIGLASCVFFLLVLVGAAQPAVVIGVDLALMGSAIFLWRRRKRVPEDPAPGEAAPGFRWNWLLTLFLGAGLLLVGATWIQTAQVNPYGEWDAWSIWNLRAKFLVGPGGAWKHAVSPLLEHTHPEYPLLTSGFTARLWKCAGGAPDWAPIATGLLFAACVPALLVGALTLLRGTSSGLLAGLVFLASTLFLVQAVSQYADVPLSFYYLATLALAALAVSARAPAKPLALAGVFASLGAWTKNEGIVFAALALSCYFLLGWRAGGLKSAFEKWRYLLLGATPVSLLVAGFKLFLSPGRELALHQPVWEAVRKLGQWDRHAAIAKALYAETLELGLGLGHPLVLLGILVVTVGISRPRDWGRPAVLAALTLGLTFAVYGGVYLITPQDLNWQLGTSVGRLYAQLWPGFLWAAFLVLKRVEDRVAPVSKAPPAKTKRREGRRKP